MSRMTRRRILAAGAAAGVLPLVSMPVFSQQSWPNRPLRLMVGFPPGSSPDLMARALAEPMAAALGQPIVVDNRPGAAGNIAADAVARSDDGHTVGLMINGNLTIAKILNPQTPYDPFTDLAPIALLVNAPLVLVGAPSLPATFAEALAQGRSQGDRWNFGSPGVGTVAHIGMEMLKSRAGLAAVHVPYQGNPAVVQALLSNEIQLSLLPPGLAMPQVTSGALRGYGITSAGRSTLVPSLDSLANQGVEGFDFQIWNALAGPAAMPAAHIERVASAAQDALRNPQTRQTVFNQGWQVVGLNAQGLARRMREDAEAMGEVIRRLGLQTG